MDLGGDTIEILTAELVEDTRDNTSYRDWANATSVTVPGCNLQPFLMAEKLQFEYNEDREFVKTGYRVFAPYDTAVGHTCRVIFDGREYEVQGETGYWRDLSGTPHHCEFVVISRHG